MVTRYFCFLLLTSVVIEVNSFLSRRQLGNYLNDEEYYGRELCTTNYCILDANRLLQSATYKTNIDPCEDFLEFSMGEFYKYQALNDRYPYVGFSIEIQHRFTEKKRKLLSKSINSSDPNIYKVLRNYFQKCVNSDIVRNEGAKDVVRHLIELGGSPFISGTSWNETGFNVSKIFLFEARHSTLLFLDHVVSRCDHPDDESKEILCFRQFKNFRRVSGDDKEYIKILKGLKFSNDLTVETVERFVSYMDMKQPIQRSKTSKPLITTVGELNKIYPSIGLNWKDLINSQLLKRSHIDENETIMIQNAESFSSLMTLLATLDKGLIADAFAVGLLYDQRDNFNVNLLSLASFSLFGTKQNFQRYEVCINSLFENMRIAFETLIASRYYNAEISQAALQMSKETVGHAIEKMEETNCIKNQEMRLDIIDHLKNMTYVIGAHHELLNLSKIEEIYEELELFGNESFVTTELKLKKHDRKFINERKTSWIKDLEIKASYDSPHYFEEENVMHIPMIFTLYPFFHPNRSRFYNTATLYSAVMRTLELGIPRYGQKVWNDSLVCFLYSDTLYNFLLGDEYYVKWEASGGKELELAGFRLTNRQMYWISIANRYASKYHISVPQTFDPRERLKLKYFHVRFKYARQFREAFNCSDMTASEKQLMVDFLTQLSNVPEDL